MFSNLSYKRIFLFLFTISILSFFSNISLEDANIMEARNFITAREMVHEGNWIITTMNGNFRFEKPPLPTWLSAIALKLNNEREDLSILRAPAALFTTLLIFLFFGLVLQLTRDREASFISALVLATSFLIFKMGRTGSWDIFTHIFMIGSIFYLIKSKEKSIYSFISGIFMGLSFMSKGPVSLFGMFIPFALSYYIVYKPNLRNFSKKKLIIFLTTSFIVGSSWYLYIYIFQSKALMQVASIESKAWVNKHTQPFWYYLHFPIFSGVWFILGIASLFKNKVAKLAVNVKTYKFTLFWVLLSLLLLSIIPEKKERYLLPVIIPMAALTGQFITGTYRTLKKNKFETITFTIHSVIMVILSLAVPGLVYIKGYLNNTVSLSYFLFILTFYVLTALLFVKFFISKKIINTFILTVFLMVFSNLFFTGFYIKNISQRADQHYKNLVEIKKTDLLKNLDVYSLDTFDIREVWRVGKNIKQKDINQLKNLENTFALFSYDSKKVYLNKTFSSVKEYTFYHKRDSEKKVHIYIINN